MKQGAWRIAVAAMLGISAAGTLRADPPRVADLVAVRAGGLTLGSCMLDGATLHAPLAQVCHHSRRSPGAATMASK